MLAVTVVDLHYVVEGCVEEGKLAKHHCGGDRAISAEVVQAAERCVWGGRWGSAGLGPGGEKLEGVAGAGASSRALCYKVSTLKTLGTGDTDQGAALAGLLPRGSHLHPGAGP